MSQFQRSMIVMYVGMAVAMVFGYVAFKACGGAATQTPASLASAPGVIDRANDAATSADARMIIQAIEAYREQTGYLPAVADVTPTGALDEYLPGWPDNPFAGQPMAPGTAPGDYTYEPSADGLTYSFTIVYSTGPAQLK